LVIKKATSALFFASIGTYNSPRHDAILERVTRNHYFSSAITQAIIGPTMRLMQSNPGGTPKDFS
jgi:hypothetical protein